MISTKKLLKATKQESTISSLDFSAGQKRRSPVGERADGTFPSNGQIPSVGESGQFGGFLKKSK